MNKHLRLTKASSLYSFWSSIRWFMDLIAFSAISCRTKYREMTPTTANFYDELKLPPKVREGRIWRSLETLQGISRERKIKTWAKKVKPQERKCVMGESDRIRTTAKSVNNRTCSYLRAFSSSARSASRMVSVEMIFASKGHRNIDDLCQQGIHICERNGRYSTVDRLSVLETVLEMKYMSTTTQQPIRQKTT